MTSSSLLDWEGRYATLLETKADGLNSTPESFDWYIDATAFASLLRPHLRTSEDEILIPGCGTSALPLVLQALGFTRLTCIDSSPSAVEAAKQIWRSGSNARAREGQRGQDSLDDADFAVMDAADLGSAVPDGAFDVVADKGLLDAFLASGPDGARRAKNYLTEVARALKDDGRLVVLSHGKPESRLPLLQSAGFVVTAKPVPKPNVPGVDVGTSPFYHAYFAVRPGAVPVPMPDPSEPALPRGGLVRF